MTQYYLLWAVGPDHPGLVAAVTEILFKSRCNLEDSSMMRLGAEFGMFLIFSSASNKTAALSKQVEALEKKSHLTMGLKPISKKLARFTPLKKNGYRLTLHGADRPGIVHAVTRTLARYKFNISDLETHRTTAGKKAGYILFIEGDLPSTHQLKKLSSSLRLLGKKFQLTLHLEPLHSTVI